MRPEVYDAVRTRWGWAARGDRALFRVSGDRCTEMVDGIVTNDLKATPVGRAIWALMLTPKGRVLADLRILHREEGLWLDVPAVAVENLKAAFRKFLPPRFARAEFWSQGCVMGLYGPGAAAAVAEVAGATAPEVPLAFVETSRDGDLLVVVRDDLLGVPGCEILASRPALTSLEAALATYSERAGGARVDEGTLEVLRVEAGLPRYGVEVSEQNIVQETGWGDRAVSFSKGCYVGQEVVVRVHHRGHPNRYLRGLRFESEPPAAGAALFAEGRPVGTVTTAVASPRLGPIGLGYVRREVTPPARVQVGGADSAASAQVVALPFPS